MTTVVPGTTPSGAYMTAESGLPGNTVVTARLGPVTNITATMDDSGTTTMRWDSVRTQPWASGAELTSTAVTYTLNSSAQGGCSGETTDQTYAGNWSPGTACSISYHYLGWTSEAAMVRIPTDDIWIEGSPYRVAFSSDGTAAYVANRQRNTVSVIDSRTRLVSATIAVSGYPMGVAVSKTTSKAYVTNRDAGTVSVIDTTTNTVEQKTIPVGSQPVDIVLSPDGSTAFVVNQGSSTVSVVDTGSKTVTRTITTTNRPTRIVLTDDGHTAYVGAGTAKAVTKIDVADTTTSTVDVSTPIKAKSISIAPDGSKMYLAGGLADGLHILDLKTGATEKMENVSPFDVAVSGDGATLYAICAANVSIIDSATKALIATRNLGYMGSTGTLSPSGSLLYVVSSTGHVMVIPAK